MGCIIHGVAKSRTRPSVFHFHFHFGSWGKVVRGRVSQVALVVKNLPANAGDTRDTGLIPGSARYPGGGLGNPLQYSCLENAMDRRAWRARVHRVLQTRLKQLSMQACTHAKLESYRLKTRQRKEPRSWPLGSLHSLYRSLISSPSELTFQAPWLHKCNNANTVYRENVFY